MRHGHSRTGRRRKNDGESVTDARRGARLDGWLKTGTSTGRTSLLDPPRYAGAGMPNTSRTFSMSSAGVKGLARKAIPLSSTPW